MTDAQLADRIRQMQATEDRCRTKGLQPNRTRRDKIARYEDEAIRRTRAADAQAAADARDKTPTVNLPPTPPPTIAPPARTTAPVPPPPPPDTRSGLDRAVEQLVRQYTSGAVIDAAWEAAHRIFGVA